MSGEESIHVTMIVIGMKIVHTFTFYFHNLSRVTSMWCCLEAELEEF